MLRAAKKGLPEPLLELGYRELCLRQLPCKSSCATRRGLRLFALPATFAIGTLTTLACLC